MYKNWLHCALPDGAILEHELLLGVDFPVVPLTRPTQGLGDFDETVVEAEVVTDRVFPTLVGATEK